MWEKDFKKLSSHDSSPSVKYLSIIVVSQNRRTNRTYVRPLKLLVRKRS